jgi:hypothetical protein
MQVKDVDRGYKDLVKRVFEARRAKLEAGILEADGARADGDLTVLEVATYNEFGTENVPERSFLRAWFDANEPAISEILRKQLGLVVAGKLTSEQALARVGAWCVGQIQQRIADGIDPANAPATIAAKGSSTPLIDTGTLRSSISYRVDEGT